jgi:ArsR family transcriptional regulator
MEGLVSARRDGKAIYYSIADARVRELVRLMYVMFCGPEGAGTETIGAMLEPKLAAIA